MDETCAHSLDPIPDEQFLETHDAAEGKPAGVRFLAFNTVIDIEAYGETAACQTAFEEVRALCRLYERLFSRTLPHSDIARINSAHGQPVAIDPLTYDLLERALSYCAESEGAFDITVGPAVRLWNFHEGTVPDDGALAEAVRHVDWHALKLWKAATAPAAESDADAATEAVPGFETEPEPKACFAQLADPDAAVDAGGIAKGWIADALVAAMEAHGLSGTIVNLGGNVAVSGTKPTGDPWRVGIRDPRDLPAHRRRAPGCGVGCHEWRLRALFHRTRRHLLPPHPRSAHGTPRRNRRGRRHRHLREIHRRGGLLYHPARPRP